MFTFEALRNIKDRCLYVRDTILFGADPEEDNSDQLTEALEAVRGKAEAHTVLAVSLLEQAAQHLELAAIEMEELLNAE